MIDRRAQLSRVIRRTNKIVKVVSLIKVFMIAIVMGYRSQLSPI